MNPPALLSPRQRSLTRAVAVAVFVVAMIARVLWLPRLETINDELLNLESYRQQISDDWRLPVAERRIQTIGRLSDERRAQLRSLYETSKPARVALSLIGDTPSQFYAAFAQANRALFGPGVYSIRWPSLVFAAGAFAVLYAIGTRLRDESLGLLLVVLAACSPLAEVYAAVGRGHMLVFLALCVLQWAFVRARRSADDRSAGVFAAALLCQAVHWGTWLLVLAFVMVEVALLWRRYRSVKAVARRTWWYALASVALAGLFVVVSLLTTAAGNLGYKGAGTLLYWLGTASPFGAIEGVAPAPLVIAAGILFSMLAIGGAFARGEQRGDRLLRAFYLALAAGTLLSMVAMCNGIRHMMLYLPGLLVPAGLGVFWLARTWAARLTVAIAFFLVVQVMLASVRPDPYRTYFDTDMRYSKVAAILRERVRPGDRWTTYPYFLADCLYPHRPLPVPVASFDVAQYEAALADRSSAGDLYVLTRIDKWRPEWTPTRVAETWRFENGFVLVRLPRIADAASGPATRP